MLSDNQKFSLAQIDCDQLGRRLTAEIAAVTGSRRVQLFSWNPTILLSEFSKGVSESAESPDLVVIRGCLGSLGSVVLWGSNLSAHRIEGLPVTQEIHSLLATAGEHQQNREINQFLSGFLHDVRGPWRRLVTMTTLMGEQELSQEAFAHLLRQEDGQMEPLLQLAQRFADSLVRRDSGSCLLRDAWNRTTHQYHKRKPEQNILFDIKIPAQLSIEASETDISEVFYQLLDNVGKFADRPSAFKIGCEPALSNYYIVRVEDSGPGLEPQFAQKLFKPFFRAHGSSFAGNGIGLFLCRQILRRLGGKIDVAASESVGGLRFDIWLPSV